MYSPFSIWNTRSFRLSWSMRIFCLAAQTGAKHAKLLHISLRKHRLDNESTCSRMPAGTSQMKSWNCVKPFNLPVKRWTSRPVCQIVPWKSARKLLKRPLTRQQVLQRKYLLEATTIRAEGKRKVKIDSLNFQAQRNRSKRLIWTWPWAWNCWYWRQILLRKLFPFSMARSKK